MRCFGVILHISSLPSAWGIGDMGPAAYAFADLLAEAGAGVWQFLPLNPTSTFIGNSPYSSPSAFAGNPLFISPELLVRDRYLSAADLHSIANQIQAEDADAAGVDFAAVTAQRRQLLHAAFERSCHLLPQHQDFLRFCDTHAHWLDDYARFVSLKEFHGGRAWFDWPEPYAHREPGALAQWDEEASRAICKEKFIQYLFFSQWNDLRVACNAKGIRLVADVPIYVTHDSADVWAAPDYFNLDAALRPITVAGVPPDYFSETGQRWGNPIYRWDRMAEDGFSWWKRRLGHVLDMADMARLDHFRGFCGYWEVPAEEETAVNGAWQPAPGATFFMALRTHFGSLPFLAEDLGVITDDVRDVMREFDLPGMHVLQFAFAGEDFTENTSLPHAYGTHCAVYTGTHDNTTTRAWFQSAGSQERQNVTDYLGQAVTPDTIVPALARLAFASVAAYAVLPMQDILQLDAAARMNTPGLAAGNWCWRMTADQMRAECFAWVTELARLYSRLPKPVIDPGPQEND